MIPLDGIIAFLSLKTGIKIILGWEIILSVISFYLIVILYLKRDKIIKSLNYKYLLNEIKDKAKIQFNLRG